MPSPSTPSAIAADTPEIAQRIQETYALVEIIARQLRRQLGMKQSLEDLISFGHEGLLQAARRFEAERGVPFKRWANLRIRGAMLDGVRRSGNLPRRVYVQIRALQASDEVQHAKIEDDAAKPAPASAEEADGQLTGYLRAMATAMAVQFLASPTGDELDHVSDDENDSPEGLALRKEMVEDLRETLLTLPDGERTLLTRYYFDDQTLEEAGKELGLSKSWACRLHARALETIEKRLRNKYR